jgi:hypothetical protein
MATTEKKRLFEEKAPAKFLSDLSVVLSLPWDKVMTLASDMQEMESIYELSEVMHVWGEKANVEREQREPASRFISCLWGHAAADGFTIADTISELQSYGFPANRRSDAENLLRLLSSEQAIKRRRRMVANTAHLLGTGIPIVTTVNTAYDSRLVSDLKTPGEQWRLPVILVTLRMEKEYQQQTEDVVTVQFTIRELRSIVRILQEELEKASKTPA